MFLYGKNSVLERLKANPESIQAIFLQDNFRDSYIERLIKTRRIPTERLSPDKLSKIKPADNLQGIIARIEKYRYVSFDALLNRSRNNQLGLIFLDRVFDPQNLGAIIRTAACFGEFAVIIPRFKACQVNETVLHVAQGGENYVFVSMVSNLSNAIIAAKKRGYWIMGGELSQDAENINQLSLPFPLALVLGSEGQGIRYGVRKHLDIKVRIPMQGAKLSFNVTAACAIFCHEIRKSRISLSRNKLNADA